MPAPSIRSGTPPVVTMYRIFSVNWRLWRHAATGRAIRESYSALETISSWLARMWHTFGGGIPRF